MSFIFGMNDSCPKIRKNVILLKICNNEKVTEKGVELSFLSKRVYFSYLLLRITHYS